MILNCNTSRSRLPCIRSKSKYKHWEKTYKTAEVKLNIWFFLFPFNLYVLLNCFISVFEGTQPKKTFKYELKIVFYYVLYFNGDGITSFTNSTSELPTAHSQHTNLLLMMTQWMRPFPDTTQIFCRTASSRTSTLFYCIFSPLLKKATIIGLNWKKQKTQTHSYPRFPSTLAAFSRAIKSTLSFRTATDRAIINPKYSILDTKKINTYIKLLLAGIFLQILILNQKNRCKIT